MVVTTKVLLAERCWMARLQLTAPLYAKSCCMWWHSLWGSQSAASTGSMQVVCICAWDGQRVPLEGCFGWPCVLAARQPSCRSDQEADFLVCHNVSCRMLGGWHLTATRRRVVCWQLLQEVTWQCAGTWVLPEKAVFAGSPSACLHAAAVHSSRCELLSRLVTACL